MAGRRCGPHRGRLRRRRQDGHRGVPGPADPPTSAPERTGPAANSAPSVAVGETSLGSVLVDGEGMTLYLFTPDSDGVPICGGSCAEPWPPVVDDEPVAGEGVDASLLGTVDRSDGSSQMTYAGHPLYRYGEDSQPGDVSGQGESTTCGSRLRRMDGGARGVVACRCRRLLTGDRGLPTQWAMTTQHSPGRGSSRSGTSSPSVSAAAATRSPLRPQTISTWVAASGWNGQFRTRISSPSV